MEPRNVAVLSVISLALLSCCCPIADSVNTTAIPIPDYMWQLYSSKGSSNVNPLDTVRSFSSTLISNQCQNFKYQVHCKWLFEFNCTIPRSETLNSADLHFPERLPRSTLVHLCDVTGSGERSSCILFNKLHTDRLRITELIQQLLQASSYVKLSIQLTLCNSSRSESIPSAISQSGITLILSSTDQDHQSNQRRSYRQKRDIDFEDLEEDSNRIWENHIPNPKPVATLSPKGKPKKGAKNPNCRRRPMHVDFASIHYDTWIIAPRGFEAFECVGRCQFPLSDHVTPTKHAIVQALLHTVTPDKITRPCCVPTRLEPISLLYVDDNGVVTYKYNYEDMVVAECGCR